MNAERLSVNPWFSMWTRPRATIQQIIDTNPKYLVIRLAMLMGFIEFLHEATAFNLGNRMGLVEIFGMAILVGAIGGIIYLYLFAALLQWTGRWVGGKGTAVNIRAAMTWPNVPLIWGLLLWIPEFALFGTDVFARDVPGIKTSPALMSASIIFNLTDAVIGVWSLILHLKCLGQVQGFSAWRALSNSMIAGLVIVVPLMILALVVAELAA